MTSRFETSGRGGVLAVALAFAGISTHWAATARGKPPPPRYDAGAALDALDLTPDQRAKADAILEDFHKKEQQARDAMNQQMKEMLTAEQFEQFSKATRRPGPPPPRPDRDEAQNVPAPSAPATPAAPLLPLADGETRVTVTFTGGHDTDPRDGGRPVVLVALALGVPEDVFRETFTHVHPAGPGQQPQDAQLRENKAALMRGLSKYGVTNDRLDEVSNYYRYVRSRGELWTNHPAQAFAIVRNGVVTGFTITDAGAGYSTPPTAAVTGLPDVATHVELLFSKDLKTNGSIQTVTVQTKK